MWLFLIFSAHLLLCTDQTEQSDPLHFAIDLSSDEVMHDAESRYPTHSPVAHPPTTGPTWSDKGIVDMFTRQNPGQVDPVGQIHELLLSCFDDRFLKAHGAPNGGELIIKGPDEFRDVELTFQVDGDDKGFGCVLTWDAWLVRRGNIHSIHRDTGEPVKKRAALYGPLDIFLDNSGDIESNMLKQVTGITIEIYKTHWEVTTFHPNYLVSMNFMKTFIALGLTVHSRLVNQPVVVRLSDMSPYRELSWLLRGLGRTFYEYDWNLEYECLIKRLNLAGRQQFYQHSQRAGDALAARALNVPASQRYVPMINAWSWESQLRIFCDEFKEEMEEWMAIDLEAKKRMTCRVAAKNFLHFTRSKNKYLLRKSIEIAQNTFMFFYRGDPHFDLLARQILSGYDLSCYVMQGIPRLHQLSNLEIIYRPSFLMRSMQFQTFGSGSAGSNSAAGSSSMPQSSGSAGAGPSGVQPSAPGQSADSAINVDPNTAIVTVADPGAGPGEDH